jgi:hypothetical protein
MTVPMLRALQKVWETSPPVAVSVGALLRGLSGKRGPAREMERQVSLEEIAGALSQGGGFVVR